MPLSPLAPELVPFDDVAAVLAEAAARAPGGPPAFVALSGCQLAAAPDPEGFQVMRRPASGPQLTL